MIPYIEKLVSDYLRADAGTEAIVGRRVVGKTPDMVAKPWVRVTQLDATAEGGSVPDHLITFLVQFDCYAGAVGGQPEANRLARTVRAALNVIGEAEHEDAVITGARILGHIRIPDSELESTRERFVLTAQIWAHS